MNINKDKKTVAVKSPKGPKRPDPVRVIRNRLKDACCEVVVTQFTDYRIYLQALYDFLKINQKSYSYQRFSADLGLSETNALWQVLTSRRDLSTASSEKIAQTLPWAFEHKKFFTLLVKHNNSSNSDVREECMREMITLKGRSLNEPEKETALEYFSEWYHPVIREMVGLEDFQADPDWINKKLFLKLSAKRIENSLSLLHKLKLIHFDTDKGRYVQSQIQIFPDRKVDALASIRYHQKACEVAKESVAGIEVDRRDLNVLTLCISDELAKDAIKILHQACSQIMELESKAQKRDQVYQINVQLFAMTNKIQ